MSSQEPSRGRSPFYSERSRVSPLPITGICCFHTHTNPLNPEPFFYPKRPRQFFSELCHYTTNQHHQCGVCRIPLGNSLGVSLPTLPVMIRRRGRRRCFVQRKRWSRGLYHPAVLTCDSPVLTGQVGDRGCSVPSGGRAGRIRQIADIVVLIHGSPDDTAQFSSFL